MYYTCHVTYIDGNRPEGTNSGVLGHYLVSNLEGSIHGEGGCFVFSSNDLREVFGSSKYVRDLFIQLIERLSYKERKRRAQRGDRLLERTYRPTERRKERGRTENTSETEIK